MSYILETRNILVGSLWSHFNELFKLSTTHQGRIPPSSSSCFFVSRRYGLPCSPSPLKCYLILNDLVEEEVLSLPLEVLHHLGNMTIARYIHDRISPPSPSASFLVSSLYFFSSPPSPPPLMPFSDFFLTLHP